MKPVRKNVRHCFPVSRNHTDSRMAPTEAFDSWVRLNKLFLKTATGDDVLNAWLAGCAWQKEQDAKVAESFQAKKVTGSQLSVYYLAGEIATTIRSQS